MSSPTRVIFQNFNLFAGPAALSGTTATGALYTSGNSGQNLIQQLSRVQNNSLTIGLPRQDVYQEGQLERVDSEFVSPATFTLTFDYYLTNGYNEYVLGLNNNGGSFLSGILTKVSDSKNYFITVSPQGTDNDGTTNPNVLNTYAVGNGYISNYSMNAAVDQLSTASVTVEGLNAGVWTGSSGIQTPAIQTDQQIPATWLYQIPPATPITGGNVVSALRPSEILLSFPSQAGFLSSLSGSNTIRVQSVSLSLPLSRAVLNQLGSYYGYSREINFPVTATLAIRAIATDINPNSYSTLLCNDNFYNLSLQMNQPGCNNTGAAAIIWGFNKAKLTNWAQSNPINGNSTVDLSYSITVAGASSLNGVTMSGYYGGQ